MTKPMRAKLTIRNVEKFEGSERITFGAVYKTSYDADELDEDNTFSKFTPQADLSMSLAAPNLMGVYKTGDTFYVDFTPC
jgi:hypothetical protein